MPRRKHPCADCGKPISNHSVRCRECHKVHQKNNPLVYQRYSSTSPPTKTCKDCGKEFVGFSHRCDFCKELHEQKKRDEKKKGTGFCLDCGEAVSKNSIRCTGCHTKSIKMPDVFCLDCGKKLPRRRKSRPRKTGRCTSCAATYLNLKGVIGPPRTGKTTIQCAQCGKSYEAYPNRIKDGTKYCSRECAGLSQRVERTTKTCSHCKKEFTIRDTSWGNMRIYCSRQCAFDVGRVEKECLNCGKQFIARKSAVDYGNEKYCDLKCFKEHLAKLRQPYMKEKPCLNCGKMLSINTKSKWEVKRKFCDRKCLYQYQSGENHPNWNSNRENYPRRFSDPFKALIRGRDNYKCAVCRMYGKVVHHIDYNKKNTNRWNCITLCQRCHNKTNVIRERRYWYETLSEVLRNRIGDNPLFFCLAQDFVPYVAKRKLYQDEDWLREHCHNNLSVREIAQIARCSKATIQTYLRKYNISSKATPKGRKQIVHKLYRNAEWLKKQCHDNRLNSREIAQLIGTSEYTIKRWMKTYGISSKGKLYQDECWLKEQYRDNNLSVQEIAKIAGCNDGTIQRRLKQFGIISSSVKLYHDFEWLKEQRQDKGLTLKEIAEIAECTAPTIGIHLKRHNLTW